MRFARLFLLTMLGIAIGKGLMAALPEEKEVDPIEAIIEKSMKTMARASEVSRRADQRVVLKVSEMKAEIEVLEEEKAVLVEQNAQYMEAVQTIQEHYNEIVKRDSAVNQPFDLFAILPDTAGRG
jgi:hypothetical protein